MSSSADRVKVFAGIQRRRRYSVEQKLAVLAEAVVSGLTISDVSSFRALRRQCIAR